MDGDDPQPRDDTRLRGHSQPHHDSQPYHDRAPCPDPQPTRDPQSVARDRAELLRVIRDKAIVHGDFVLSSGQRATWYIDLRRILLSGSSAGLAGRVMLAATDGLDYDAVGGLTLGADPVATAMMHAAAARGRIIDAFIVRKSGKAHGLQRRIEGPSVVGRRVLAVEDTSTTGASVLTAVDALRDAGAHVAGVAVLVDRGAAGRVTSRGLVFRAAYDVGELGLD